MRDRYHSCKVLRVDDTIKDFHGYTDKMMLETFEIYGPIQEVRMFHNFSYIHFEERCDAQSALNSLSGSPRPPYGASLSWALYPAKPFYYPPLKSLDEATLEAGAGSVVAVWQQTNEKISKERVGELLMSTSGPWFVVPAAIDTRSRVKILRVRNLPEDFKKDKLKKVFEVYGPIIRVNKLKQSAIVLFEKRTTALQAMEAVNGIIWKGRKLSVVLGHPRSDEDFDFELSQQLRDVELGTPPVFSEPSTGRGRNLGNGKRGLEQRERWRHVPANGLMN